MKRIYDFTLPKEETVTEIEKKKEKDGSDVTVTKDVVKTVDKKFFIRRPTRKLYDDAELFYGVRLSEGIKAGLLTRALLAKRFSNDGGILSEREKEEFGSLYTDIFDKQVEMQPLALKTKEERSKKEQQKFDELTDFLSNARERVQEFESSQSSLYDQTAENRARNKTILWWVLHLAYCVNEKDEESPFFAGSTYEEKLKVYDDYEEEDDDYTLGILNKFFYYVSFWYVSKTSDPEQFKELIKFAEQADLGEDDSNYEVEFEEGREEEEYLENEKEIKKAVGEDKESVPEEKPKKRRYVKKKNTKAKVEDGAEEEGKSQEQAEKQTEEKSEKIAS